MDPWTGPTVTLEPFFRGLVQQWLSLACPLALGVGQSHSTLSLASLPYNKSSSPLTSPVADLVTASVEQVAGSQWQMVPLLTGSHSPPSPPSPHNQCQSWS